MNAWQPLVETGFFQPEEPSLEFEAIPVDFQGGQPYVGVDTGDLFKELHAFQRDGLFCDCTLLAVDGGALRAHSAVLACACVELCDLLLEYEPGHYIIQTSLSVADLHQLLYSIYTGHTVDFSAPVEDVKPVVNGAYREQDLIQLMMNLLEFQRKGSFCDCTIVLKDNTLMDVHSYILAVDIPFLRPLLLDSFGEANVGRVILRTSMDDRPLETLLKQIYIASAVDPSEAELVLEGFKPLDARECRFCSKLLSCSGNRMRHENLHCMLNPIAQAKLKPSDTSMQCRFCSKLLSCSGNRMRHENLHCKLNPIVQAKMKPSDISMQCRFCGKLLSRIANRIRHENYNCKLNLVPVVQPKPKLPRSRLKVGLRRTELYADRKSREDNKCKLDPEVQPEPIFRRSRSKERRTKTFADRKRHDSLHCKQGKPNPMVQLKPISPDARQCRFCRKILSQSSHRLRHEQFNCRLNPAVQTKPKPARRRPKERPPQQRHPLRDLSNVPSVNGTDASLVPHLCSQCDKTFKLPGQLKVHERLHTGERPHQCSYCSKSFTDASSLIAHARLHTGERPFLCDTCGRRFQYRTSYRNHMFTHRTSKPFRCTYHGCGKRCLQKCDLRRHMQSHTGERTATCSICSKTFFDAGTLKRHELTHTKRRPFGCELCGVGFADRSTLRTHKQCRHWQNYPYRCKSCPKRFNCSSNARKHERVCYNRGKNG